MEPPRGQLPNAGTVLLNADLLREVFRREGIVLKDFEDSPVHKNKSTVAKGTWERAINGEPIRRNSWLEIAKYLRVQPAALLLMEANATYDMIVASRCQSSSDQPGPKDIVVRRGPLTIVLGEPFSQYPGKTQEIVWKKIHELLVEVEIGPVTGGSILVNLFVNDKTLLEAVTLFLDGQFASINATDMVIEGDTYHSKPPSVQYFTQPFHSLRAFAARVLSLASSESEVDEVATDTMESVFFRLVEAGKPVTSLLQMCRIYIKRIWFTAHRSYSLFAKHFAGVPIEGLADRVADPTTPSPLRHVLNDELQMRVDQLLSQYAPSNQAEQFRSYLANIVGEVPQGTASTYHPSPEARKKVREFLRERLADYRDFNDPLYDY